MTTIAILATGPVNSDFGYCAVAGSRQSVGRTAGEALDALAAQLGPETSGALVVVQPMRADEFFTQQQRERLAELMQAWREAQDHLAEFPDELKRELDKLVDAELQAAAQRAAELKASGIANTQ